MLEDPVGDEGESFGGEGLLDAAVFHGRARGGVLEEMVQSGKFVGLKVLVTTLLEGLLDLSEIFLRGDLQILVAAEGQDRALHFFQGRNGVVIQEKSKPG